MSVRVAGAVRLGEFLLDVDLSVGDGEVLAVLGPNGAGKSTLLRVVSGLQPLESGSVSLGGVVVDAPSDGIFVPAERRNVGVVFQEHRLFPFLRVVDNAAFGLRSRGVTKPQARETARDMLIRLGIADLARRYPRQLSGGQAQRVALARALAPSPDALVLDEPLAALDVQTRALVQGELRDQLHRVTGPTLLVTHDPVEALLLSDRIAVLEGGRVVQQGSATEITSRPLTDYVARVVGLNLYRATAHGTTLTLESGAELISTDQHSGAVLAVIRPSDFTVHIEHPAASSARNVWTGKVAGLAPLGDRIRLDVAAEPNVLVDLTPAAVADLRLSIGQTVWLSAKATALTVYAAPA
jgi:molybdate transport system ATP-binding protein